MTPRTPGLMLHPVGLLSKWGFGDGDTLDDQVDASFEWDVAQRMMEGVDEHAALVDLVRRFVISACAATVEHVVMNTIHNPIRATTVDGVEVDWYEDDPAMVTRLRAPEYVVVPWDVVADVLAGHRTRQVTS